AYAEPEARAAQERAPVHGRQRMREAALQAVNEWRARSGLAGARFLGQQHEDSPSESKGLFALLLRVRTWLEQRQSPGPPRNCISDFLGWFRRATTSRLAAWARSVTTSGAVLAPFPTGCGQKGHAPRCEAWPDVKSGCVSRLAHDLFDSQRILQKQCEQALDEGGLVIPLDVFAKVIAATALGRLLGLRLGDVFLHRTGHQAGCCGDGTHGSCRCEKMPARQLALLLAHDYLLTLPWKEPQRLYGSNVALCGHMHTLGKY